MNEYARIEAIDQVTALELILLGKNTVECQIPGKGHWFPLDRFSCIDNLDSRNKFRVRLRSKPETVDDVIKLLDNGVDVAEFHHRFAMALKAEILDEVKEARGDD